MKLSDFYISLEESFRHYTVKHKRTGKQYKVTAMHDKSAIEKAKQKNMTILLSPASASYDQYKNFEERGNEFKKLIMKYAKKNI